MVQLPPGTLTRGGFRMGMLPRWRSGVIVEESQGKSCLGQISPGRQAGDQGELAAAVTAAMGVQDIPTPASRPLCRVTGSAAVTHSFRTGRSCHRAGFA